MEFVEMGLQDGKTLMLLPGTACDYQTNFATVLDRLAQKYHLICVNYDGFDGTDTIFPDMITVTKKIEEYVLSEHGGRLDGALGSSLGSSFVGQLIQRENIHIDHGIFGSPDLDQSGELSAKLQSKLVVPLLTSFTGSEKKKAKTRELLKSFFEMSDETADRFMGCFAKFSPESIKNEYYTDLLTWLENDIHVENTKVHFIYANKMGEKYLKRYRKHFRNPEIREFDMQHEQWLLGGERYTAPVLKAIDEFMGLVAVDEVPAEVVVDEMPAETDTDNLPAETAADNAFWNRLAFVYDLAMAHGNEGLSEAIGYVASFVGPYDVVLDGACGTGAFACGVAAHAGFVAACDYAPKMVERTARKVARLGLDNVACGTGDLTSLDFADDSFDVAIAANVLHLLENPQKAISELVRVTRPGGVIAIPNYMNQEDTDRRFLELASAVGFTVHHEWDTDGFLAFLSSCGLRVVEHRNFDAAQPLCVAICREA